MMATIAPMNTPSRRPFGVLNESKLRNLQSIKNRQNAITPNSVPSLKRRAPSPELSDSENVDPNIIDSFGKRKRAAFDDDVSLSKPSRYGIQIIPAAPKSVTPSVTVTPRIETVHKAAPLPLSAPPAAGRSPTRSKRSGFLKPSRRFAPPSLGSRSPSLSITAALKGTLANKRAKKARTIAESKPNTWFFDIFEESDEQQDYRMNEWTMTQSANILDISDDEMKAKEKSDRGKENIDPNNEMSAPVTRSMAAAATKAAVSKISEKDTVIDEPRTPLGDLNASDFYAEGLDATSVILVHDDVEPQEHVEPSPAPEQSLELDLSPTPDFTFQTNDKVSAPATTHEPIDTSDIGALLVASTPIWTEPQHEQLEAEKSNDLPIPMSDESGDIEIWESASAKDENEDEKDEGKFDEGQVFALQEL